MLHDSPSLAPAPTGLSNTGSEPPRQAPPAVAPPSFGDPSALAVQPDPGELYFAVLAERGRVGNTRWAAIGFFGVIAGLFLKPATDTSTIPQARPVLTLIAWLVLWAGYSLWVRLDAQTRSTRQYLEILEGRLPDKDLKLHQFPELRNLWGRYPIGFVHFVEGRIVSERVNGKIEGSRDGVAPMTGVPIQTGIDLMKLLFRSVGVLLFVLLAVQLIDLLRLYLE